MAIICPSVTAYDVATYSVQLKRLEKFAPRVHLDFMDGIFTKTQSVSLHDAWVSANESTAWDVHLMFMRPDLYVEQLTKFKPNLVIVHAEAEGNFVELADKIKALGSKVGVALLQKTPVSLIYPVIDLIDHVLVFSGNLGHYGGKVDTGLLSKVDELRNLKPGLEIGWDGGVNDRNINMLVRGGVDVLNVGGFIQQSDDPENAYAKLDSAIMKGD